MEWVFLGLLAAVVISGGVIFFRAKSTITKTFRSVYGNKTLKQVVREGEWEAENVPRSISSATSIYLPMIQKDFPDFSWNEFRQRAMNVLKCMLLAINSHDVTILPKECNLALRDQVRLIMNDDGNGGLRTRYDDITVHQVEIVRYSRKDGACVILMQASAGCKTWQEKEGKVIWGSNERLRQSKYSMELIYIQDSNKINKDIDDSKVLTCTNCGAPIRTLGTKNCEYCGAVVIEFNIKVWNFGAIKLLA